MKIITVVGARPQFVKAAAVSRELRKVHREIIVHTGQHYDDNMSKIFFEELGIPLPGYNLGVGSKSHARQTAEIMVALEDILLSEKPDAVLIYGDTNSTLAAAVTAGKLNIPLAHVEAGGRTSVMDMPEEQNRIVADHLSTWNFAPSDIALQNLKAEGIVKNAYNIGDVMYDSLLWYSKLSDRNDAEYYSRKLVYLTGDMRWAGEKYYLSTIHRPENTDDNGKFISILKGLQGLDHPVLLPLHPRTQKLISNLNVSGDFPNIHFIEPLGYIDIIFFIKNAVKVVTDSGGLHKESFLLKVPGVVLLRGSGWPETFNGNCNVTAKADQYDIMDKVLNTKIDYSGFDRSYYGDGTASKQITDILAR